MDIKEIAKQWEFQHSQSTNVLGENSASTSQTQPSANGSHL
jgi:hypothetical protein